MVLTKGTTIQVDHEVGPHPLISLVKTMYTFQQKHFEKMMNIPLTEAMLFGIASGPGFIYRTDKLMHQAIGTSSLDYLQGLATSTGTWINRRFSMNEEQAVLEMKKYLAVWKTPILVTVPQSLFSDESSVQKDEENFFSDTRVVEQPVSKCLVISFSDSVVECLIHSKKESVLIDSADFQQSLSDLSNRWVDIIFPSADVSADWLYEHSISRHIQQWVSGWKTYGNAPGNMEDFFKAFMKQPDPELWEDTFAYADNLGGDFGRGWYAEFLGKASIERQCYVLEEASRSYIALTKLWVEYITKMRSGIVDSKLSNAILLLEKESITLLASRYGKGDTVNDYCFNHKKTL